MDNCTFQGINQWGKQGSLFVYSQYPLNYTITNTKFINVALEGTSTPISNEHFAFKCPSPVYTRFIFENNTV